MKSTLALILFLAPLAAAASENAPLSAIDAVSLDAKARFKQGVNLYKQERWREALKEFKEAYRIKPAGYMLYNIALCHDRLGETAQALKNYQLFLREEPEAKERAGVQTAIAKLEKKLSDLGFQQLLVFTAPGDAELRVDEQIKGSTPWSGELSVGKHKLVLTLKGYASVKQEVDLQTHSVIVDSKLIPEVMTVEEKIVVPPPPPIAVVTPQPVELPPEALQSKKKIVDPKWPLWPGAAAIPIGAVLAGVGIYELVHANDLRNSLTGLRSPLGGIPAEQTKTARDMTNDLNSAQPWGIALVALGGALTIGGVAYLVAIPGPQGAQVSVSGNF